MTASTKENVGGLLEDPSRDPKASPYLLLPLTVDDDGKTGSRIQKPEYINLVPYCVSWQDSSVFLTIKNIGQVASDLIKVEYQLVFCVDRGHGVAEGFTRSHAGEIAGNTRDDQRLINFVPAAGSINISLPIPVLAAPFGGFANLYFRARVSTLWSRPKPTSDWDFATDVSVVEATNRFL
jgi:hypothetical protein